MSIYFVIYNFVVLDGFFSPHRIAYIIKLKDMKGSEKKTENFCEHFKLIRDRREERADEI